jgi:hypothetical protein
MMPTDITRLVLMSATTTEHCGMFALLAQGRVTLESGTGKGTLDRTGEVTAVGCVHNSSSILQRLLFEA